MKLLNIAIFVAVLAATTTFAADNGGPLRPGHVLDDEDEGGVGVPVVPFVTSREYGWEWSHETTTFDDTQQSILRKQNDRFREDGEPVAKVSRIRDKNVVVIGWRTNVYLNANRTEFTSKETEPPWWLRYEVYTTRGLTRDLNGFGYVTVLFWDQQYPRVTWVVVIPMLK